MTAHATTNGEAAAPAETVLIACAALGKEIRAIVQKHGWNVDVRVISAKLHLRPKLIGPAVEEKLIETDGKYERQIVIYGHCGAMDLDGILKERGAERTLGPHCYEMFGGDDFVTAVREEPGTFILTDFLVKAWDTLAVKGLKMDIHPKLKTIFFANYKRMIYFVQVEEQKLIDKAYEIAADIGLPLEIKHTGYGDLEHRIVALMSGEAQPTTEMTYDGYMPYPTLK